MMRVAGIVLVLWGLIFQPLIAAMPVMTSVIATHSAENMITNRTVSQHEIDTKNQANSPCHEMSDIKSTDLSNKHCDNCELGCDANGLCTSSCMSIGVVVIQPSTFSHHFKNNTIVTAGNNAAINGLPARIFHPPRNF